MVNYLKKKNMKSKALDKTLHIELQEMKLNAKKNM